MQRTILTGLAGFRWAAWTWMALVALLARGQLVRPSLALGLIALALVITAAVTVLLRIDLQALLRAPTVGAELATGAALVAADGLVYGAGHVFSPEQSLAVAWPVAGALAGGVAGGPWSGLAAGILLGGSRAGAAILNGADLSVPAHQLSILSTAVLYTLAGTVGGWLATLLVRAEREISIARAREEVARTLHDGVLQTLAVVERRTADPALARMARDQEVELRRYLFGDTQPVRDGSPGLGPALREAAAHHEDAHGGRVTVLVPEDLPELPGSTREALVGAVREALTNAGKHGRAGRVTVFVEPEDGGVFCSVKDDGRGFDTEATPEGVGLTGSVRARIDEVGGRVEVQSRPGSGTEVRLWVR